MRLLLLAPPGGGKGTQGERLAGRLGVQHISAGELLRAEAGAGTPIGHEIAAYQERGDLVPDAIVFDVLTPVVVAAVARGGYILDGFPRTLPQATAAADLGARLGLTLNAAVYLYAPEAVLVRRLLGRAEQGGRGDDTAAVIRHRLDVFTTTTSPLIAYYRDRGILLEVDADQPPEAVTTEILTRLSDHSPSRGKHMTTEPITQPVSDDVADQAAPLDALLVEAALGPLRRFAPDGSTVRFAFHLARRPRTTGRRLVGLAAELARIGAGTSTVAPSKRDRRFTDPAWTENPLLRRLVQAYQAAGRTAQQLVGDAELDWRDEQRTRFLVENLVAACSPSNLPLVNPASAKAVVDTAGMNFVRGGRNLLGDLATAPRVPEMVDKAAFEVGRTIAATPGAVVLRTEVLELIQYRPQTEQVRNVPLLIVPPTINKYYALDLAPGRSLVEYLVRRGQQVFLISWRNPDARFADWDLSTYVQAVLDALDAVQRVSGADRTALTGICSGGIIASITAAYLADTGRQGRLAALALAVTVLDNARAGTPAALADRRLAAAATALSRRRGYLDGRALAEVFAWLRPDDLIWNYWVNNYLLGKKPPAFDILFWNSDTTRMSAKLHADFVDLAMENHLVTPGALRVLGRPIDLSRIEVDSYIVAGIADHLTPWQNCYRSTQLLGGDSRFILSTSGHIAALVNPPGNPKASYQTNKDNPADAQQWLKTAETRQGSWWPDLVAWLGGRCGTERREPAKLGGGGLRPLVEAPGTYVFDS